MADTVKTLEAKIAKLKKTLEDKQGQWQKIQPVKMQHDQNLADATQFVENEFYGDANVIADKCQKFFGKRVMSLVESRKALTKMQEENKKIRVAFEKLSSEIMGLGRQIDSAEKMVEKYSKEKEQLKDALESGTIDKKEYERRKQLVKDGLADLSKLSEGKLASLEKTLKEKQEKYAKLSTDIEAKTDLWTGANKFVTKEFMGDATVIGQKCQKFFGKRVMSKKDAEKALEKLKAEMDKAKKEGEKAAAEIANLSERVRETKDRITEVEKSMERAHQRLLAGEIDEKEYQRQRDMWKKSVSLE
jgi:predicted  nucleic acid-binding Zn-ribbon protein